MPLRTIKVPPPIGGVNRALARSQQPDSPLPTCWDALNVVPYDRFGRLRVSQRSGTNPIWDDQIGDGTQNVQMLTQVTRVNVPGTGGPVTIYEDGFAYSNGNLTGNGDWTLDDDADPSWIVTGNTLFSGAASDLNANLQTVGLAGWDHTVSFSLTTHIIFTTGSSDVGKYINIQLRSTGPVDQWQFDATETSAGVVHFSLIPPSGIGDIIDVPGISMGRDTQHNLEFDWDSGTSMASILLDSVVIGTGATTAAPAGDLDLQYEGGQVLATANGGLAKVVDVFINSTAPLTPAQPRQTNIVAVSGGNIYQGTLVDQGVLTTGGMAALSDDTLPESAAIFGIVYFVDGTTTLKQLDIATQTVTIWSSTAGLETATTLGEYKIAAVYRGRLVLANTQAAPQNFVCSRVGVPTDFDYSQDDPAAAFAGNAAENGQIGEPITALIPFSDDMMGIGGDHNLWMMRGDPAADGAIDNISDQIGVLGPRAWCRAPSGLVYFVGTGGFYKWDANGKPESVADTKFNQFFADINRAENIVQCIWDRDRRGAFIFVTSIVTGESTHIWYDERTGGTFWPQQYPDRFGPISSLVYDGDGPEDRRLILGTRDGHLLQWRDNSRTDNDGDLVTAITAYVVLGPFHPGDDAAKLVGTTFQFGELSPEDQATPARWQANVTINAGPTAYDVTEGTPFQTATVQVPLDRRSKTFRQRMRGAWFSVEVSNRTNAQYFVLDDLSLEFDVAGKERRQR